VSIVSIVCLVLLSSISADGELQRILNNFVKFNVVYMHVIFLSLCVGSYWLHLSSGSMIRC
jgi:hypothetical protein